MKLLTKLPYQPCPKHKALLLVGDKHPVRISTGTPVIPTEGFYGFSQYIHKNAMMVS
jgi:hypothetical protein